MSAGSFNGRASVYGGNEAVSVAADGGALVCDAAERGVEVQGQDNGVAPWKPVSVNTPKVAGSSPVPRTPRRRVEPSKWRFPRLTWGQDLVDPAQPYLTRWVLDFGRFSIRLHHWHASDDLRAPHDHAWNFISILLAGSMLDRTPGSSGGYTGEPPTDTPRRWLRLDRFKAEHRHSVVVGPKGAWTLLLTGPIRREWGFWVPRLGGKLQGLVRFRHRNKYFHTFGHH